MKTSDERKLWLGVLLRIADPVLVNLANDKLTMNMPYVRELDTDGKREKFARLEAFGRVFNGIAPWLNLAINKESEEYLLQLKYKDLALKSLDNITNPSTKDYVDFGCGPQCLVDAAYLCQGILRYQTICEELNEEVKENVVTELRKTRKYIVAENNWLLFASMVEVTLLKLKSKCDHKRLTRGVIKFMKKFYVGDAIYGDGKVFSLNYYNSFVIHPMLTDILVVTNEKKLTIKKYLDIQATRQRRYLEILERLISPEGTFPVLGRTITCRLGAFHSMAHSVLRGDISENISYGQIRAAMTAVLNKQFSDEQRNFTKDKWLKVGFIGEQLSIAEEYINIGSTYHTCSFFLPLGLSPTHQFWTDKSQKWTNLRIWNGEESIKDKALIEENLTELIKLKNKLKYKLKSMFI
ncbi:DUF2264 domain-containing protein [Zunongwangia atlantica]|uniref:DUF2264 domain-containing protein n=1 Tax=Zunongwangia atlantica 22II14-10F7 TaxID=1185767 RepID=A0A1Y1SYB0_9FLAO|nr:DUF2264 domain-containing protein [Zunongwangia atlantica]ORL43737.1 hypothetical protein IIF7_19289 [Zunongwangia atlantica 22II14-10F7]